MARIADWNWTGILIILATIIFVGGAAGIYRYSTSKGGPKLRVLIGEYRTVLLCFGILTLMLLLIGLAAWRATPASESFGKAILQGITGSLAEDLAFFSLLGFILVIVQRREADLNRNLDDKIELLFSAKKLRSGEVAYLKEELRRISSDCRQSVTHIDVVNHDAGREFVQLDVSRQYYVGNYLSSEDAQHLLQVDLTPDTYPGDGPSMYIYPTITNSVVEAHGEWTRVADDELLDEGAELNSGDRYRPPERKLQIRPGQVREFRSRFRAWQRLYKEPLGAVDPTVRQAQQREPDVFEVTLLKHWDEIIVNVRNSLTSEVRVTISGDESRAFSILAGDEQRKAYRVENLSANSRIYISFIPV